MSKCVVGFAIVIMGCAAAPQPAAPDRAHGEAPPPSSPSTATVTPPADPASVAALQPGRPAASKSHDEVCNAPIDESLQHQLAGRAAKVRFCYEHLLLRDPRREGRMTVTVKLSGPGTIDRAWTTLDELADSETTDCALASFKEPLRGTIQGDCAIVNVPLNFKIKKPEPTPQVETGTSMPSD